MAKQKRSEKHVVVDSVKGVHVGSVTRRTKEPNGVADAGCVCVLEALPGEQGNNVGWLMLEVLPGEQTNQMGWRTLRSACVVEMLPNGH
jgi:hypothetical protein